MYYHSVAFYILMTAWKKFEKTQRRKTKNLQEKKLIFGETWKTWKRKRRNLDFKSGFCTWLATTHNISYSWQSWQCSVLTIINTTFIIKKVITWSISNVLIPEYRNDYFKTHINYLSNGVLRGYFSISIFLPNHIISG